VRIVNQIIVAGAAALLTVATISRVQAAAPASVAGKAVFLAIQNGTGVFDSGKGLAIAPAVSGSGFTLVGAGSTPLSGSYTYSGGTMTLNVSGAGQYQLNLQFTNDYQGTFTLDGSEGTASGPFWYLSEPVPASMVNSELDMTPSIDGVIAKVVTAASGTKYTTENSSDAVQSTGTYAYSRINPCLAKLVIHDSVQGVGTAFFGFYQGNNGLFGIQGSSVTEVVQCTLVSQAPTAGTSVLTIHSTAGGSFSPNLGGQLLQLGKTYKITAKPDTGYIFAGWSGEFASSSPALSFTMKSNLVLEASFVSNPFPAVAGTYNGMFPSVNSQSFAAAANFAPLPNDLMTVDPSTIGSFSFSVTTKGTYSGKVRMGSATYSVSGQFAANGVAAKTITTKAGTTLTLNLNLLSTTNVLRGTIGNGTNWVNSLVANRCLYNTKSATPLAGNTYTFVLPTPADSWGTNDATVYAYGTVSISAAGAVKLTGSLPDGTKIAQKSTLAQNGSWPLCLQLYKGTGLLAGWVTCQTNELTGLTRWVRPADAKAHCYAQGLDYPAELHSSRYNANAASFLGFTNGLVEFRDGNLVNTFSNKVEIVAGPKVINHSDNKLTLKFTKPSGQFSGSVTPPGATRAVPFKGVVLQNQNFGAGYFLGTNAPGAVTLGTNL
jgi:hypothetical protein